MLPGKEFVKSDCCAPGYEKAAKYFLGEDLGGQLGYLSFFLSFHQVVLQGGNHSLRNSTIDPGHQLLRPFFPLFELVDLPLHVRETLEVLPLILIRSQDVYYSSS